MALAKGEGQAAEQGLDNFCSLNMKPEIAIQTMRDVIRRKHLSLSTEALGVRSPLDALK